MIEMVLLSGLFSNTAMTADVGSTLVRCRCRRCRYLAALMMEGVGGRRQDSK
jgi:hypothetical protein